MSVSHPKLLIDLLGEDAAPIDVLVTLWSLRLIVRGKGYRRLLSSQGRIDIEVAECIGLDTSEGAAEPYQAVRLLRERLADLETRGAPYPSEMAHNLAAFRHQLGLTADEADIAACVALSECIDTLQSATRAALAATGRLGMEGPIAAALNLETERVSEALAPGARLRRSGVIQRTPVRRRSWQEHRSAEVRRHLEPLEGLGGALLAHRTDIADFFRGFVRPVDRDRHVRLDLEHMQADVEHLSALLRGSLEAGATGMNALLTGPPGVGKTALARWIAEACGAEAYEIPTADSTTDASLHGRHRFHAMQVAQYLLSGRTDAVLIFDEVEDVFAGGQFGAEDSLDVAGSVTGKGWTNRLLEASPIPTIWIANSLRGMDSAFLRRFDHVLEMRCPPRATRERMLADAMEDMPVSADWIHRQAASDGLTPAQIDQAGRLAGRLRASLDDDALEPALDTQLRRHQRLQGHRPRPARRGADVLPYDLDHVTADPPPREIIDGLAAHGDGRILLYGPPGTGKTAFAHEVAKRLNRPLVARRASDLLSCWVGATEQNLAAMFEEAHDTGAVLFLDEADSFLQAREGARNHWEVTQTNELLCQIEAFEGMSLFATNLIEALDPASMRRFDVNMELMPPHAHMRWALFCELLQGLHLEIPGDGECSSLRSILNHLSGLVPGDFVTVGRKFRRFANESSTASDVLDALKREQRQRRFYSQDRPGFL